MPGVPTLLLSFCLYLAPTPYGCGSLCRYYGETQGVMLDSMDGRPIKGAAVVGIYYVNHGTVGGTVTEMLDAGETTTNAQGRFVLPAKFVFSPRLPPAHFGARPYLYLFAPGYEPVELLATDQAYSRVDCKRIPVTETTYRIEARPLLTVARGPQGKAYEFRVSRLATDQARAEAIGSHYFSGPAAKFPNYLAVCNAERARYGQPAWKGWPGPSARDRWIGEAGKVLTAIVCLQEAFGAATSEQR